MSVPRTILVVDDDPQFANALKGLLEDAGKIVHVASDGRAALVLLESGLNPDRILLDFNMPFSGMEFMNELRIRDWPGRWDRVIGMTGHADDCALTLRRTLRKPFSFEELLAAIDEDPSSTAFLDHRHAEHDRGGRFRGGRIRGEGMACLAMFAFFIAAAWFGVETLVAARMAAVPATRIVVVPDVEYRLAPTIFDVDGPVSVAPSMEMNRWIAQQNAAQRAETERLRRRHAGL